MKKYLLSALALPLLFACSSEDYLDQKATDNDQFAGIEKVDATFSMDEGTITRMDNGSWDPQEGDLWGFAWLTDDHTATPSYTPLIAIDGKAYQNHNLIQKSNYFEPQTSIYVGKYYIYRPYDKTTVSPQAINFKSLENQALVEGFASTTDAWKNLAKTAINIGDKWTEVTPDGHTIGTDPTIWDKAGIKQYYKLYASMFSNQTGLDLTYVKNNPTFAAAATITGATDINYTIAAGTAVGAADIYEATVNLSGQAKSFTYAPTKEPNTAAHNGSFWADKKGLPTAAQDGFTFTPGAVKLIPADATNGLSTGDNNSTAWFWFNSLPNTAGNAVNTDNVTTVFTTSYGVVTVTEQLKDCAYAFEQPKGAAATAPKEWIKLAAATDETKTPKEWNPAVENTFINQYGNHKGKYAFDVDFSTGVMNGMDIRNDAHLQKLLKYYIASNKTNEPNVVLNLLPASATDNTFKISKLSIALLQTINRGTNKVYVDATGLSKVIVTQDGQAALDLADKKEVPELDDVFNTPTVVALSKDCEWTWKQRTGLNQLTIDANVASLTNEGTLTVNADNIDLSIAGKTITNAAGATMNITKVTTVKTALTNLGTINVPAGAELRAYDVEIKNDATSLTDYGVINNAGVVGVTYATTGTVNNYGKIIMENSDAITLLTSNQTAAGDFDNAFNAGTNKLGTVVLPAGQPNALVSVSNGAETGFIEYTWTGSTTYATPNDGIVKYNTLIVSDNIAFTTAEPEIRFIKFEGVRKTVTNSTNTNLPSLKGIIIKDNCSIIIEKSNTISCSEGSHLGNGAAVYNGGAFTPGNTSIVGKVVTDYLGTWNTDQVVVW